MRKLILFFLLAFVLPVSAQWGASGAAFRWLVQGQAQKQDSLRLIQGSNITLTQSGNTVTVTGAAGGVDAAGARKHTGWTTQTSPIATDTTVARYRVDAINAEFVIVDADNDTIKIRPQSSSGKNVLEYKDAATALLTADSLGNLALGGSTWGTSAANVLAITNGTAPSTSPANTFQLYSSGGEANIRDANGLTSALTNEYAMLARNSSTTIALNTNTYAKVTFNAALSVQGVTAVTDSITVARAGVYQVFFNMSAATAAGSDAYTVSIFINQSQASNAETLAQLATTNTSVFAMFQFALAANDDIAVMIKNTTDADDITINRAALILNRID